MEGTKGGREEDGKGGEATPLLAAATAEAGVRPWCSCCEVLGLTQLPL